MEFHRQCLLSTIFLIIGLFLLCEVISVCFVRRRFQSFSFMVTLGSHGVGLYGSGSILVGGCSTFAWRPQWQRVPTTFGGILGSFQSGCFPRLVDIWFLDGCGGFVLSTSYCRRPATLRRVAWACLDFWGGCLDTFTYDLAFWVLGVGDTLYKSYTAIPLLQVLVNFCESVGWRFSLRTTIYRVLKRIENHLFYLGDLDFYLNLYARWLKSSFIVVMSV